MHESCDSLVTTLQKELQEYGALLGLFDAQQGHLLRHDAAGFIAINCQVDRQLEDLTRTRTLREALVSHLAVEQREAPTTRLKDLVRSFPSSRQPLLLALIEEINNLLASTNRRAQQNRMLLARCVEAARETIQSANPAGAHSSGYTAKGQIYAFRPSNDHFPAAVA